jgi:hypothetical protein
MKAKYFLASGVIIFMFVSLANSSFAEDPSHEAAMSMLTNFFSNPSARADYSSKNPEALKAEQNLSQFPPHIQKRLEKVVLMILQESGAKATKHVDAMNTAGAEAAFSSFSPAVQQEIQSIAKELEHDPEFMK